MTVVETSVWVDLLRGRWNDRTKWLQDHLRDPELIVLDLVYYEVLRGVRESEDYEGIRRALRAYSVQATGGEDLAEQAAANFRFLRRRGITVRSSIDCLIATYCLSGKHSLLHHDRDFESFEMHLGLQVIHPQSSI